jgi:hypothetical protein
MLLRQYYKSSSDTDAADRWNTMKQTCVGIFFSFPGVRGGAAGIGAPTYGLSFTQITSLERGRGKLLIQ